MTQTLLPLLALAGALALAPVPGAGDALAKATPAEATTTGAAGAAASCLEAIPANDCAGQLRTLCRAIGAAAVPPLKGRQRAAMNALVAAVGANIEHHWLDRASGALDDLRQRLDGLQGALTPEIANKDAARIGDALNNASFCVDGM